jgi:hypothetical protein
VSFELNLGSLEALSRFESLRGSQIRFGFESRQSRSGNRLPNGEMIYRISRFVALFLAAFGRLDPFDPRLMYLWALFSTFRVV